MKILIVDDEMVIRLGLKSLIDWEEKGYKLVGEASDGKKALEAIVEKQPDIVITDIKMPVMDGIELIREAKKLSRPPRFIVLSSYNDFELVRDAMKLGAQEYMLKLEMEPESLIKLLEGVREKIEEEGQQKEKNLQINTQIRKNIPVIRKKLLRDIACGAYLMEKDFEDSREFLDISLDMDHLCCLVMRAEEIYKFEAMAEGDIDLLDFSIINITEEILSDNFTGHCFEVRKGEYCAVFSPREAGPAWFDDRSYADMARRIAEMLYKYLNITVAVGIGERDRGVKGIRQSCLQAQKALEYRFFQADGKIVLWKEIKSLAKPSGDEYSVLSHKERLHSAMDFHDEKELHRFFKSMGEDMARARLSQSAACNVGLELFYMISEFFEKYQVNIRKILKTSYRTYQQLTYIGSFSQLCDWMKQVEEELTEYIREEARADYPRIIAKAKKYIEEYFNQDISLKEVADSVNLNPSYFSTLFMQNTGVSYTEHLTKIRIEKAKALLKDTDYKVYEIAEMIGYQNVTYFNRTFKKITGVTPVEYKNRIVKV